MNFAQEGRRRKMKYDYKKTIWKFAKTGIYVAIAGVLSVYADNPYVLALAPLLHAIENYIKHRND